MKSVSATFVATVTLIGILAIPAGVAANNADSRIISFEAPGAGNKFNQATGIGQGTGCFVVTACHFTINQWGAIVGTYLDANNVYHGFIRSPRGEYTTIDAPCADTTAQSYNGTVAESINDLGEITGFCIDAQGNIHGFVRSPQGTFTEFDALEPAIETVPLFINLEGATAGFVYDSTANLFRAFVRYPNGALPVFVGPGSCPLGFNEVPNPCYGSGVGYVSLFGASVGNFEDSNLVGHGLLRNPKGGLTTFDVPGGGTGIYQGTGCPGCTSGVNFFGVIAGEYIDSNNTFHGFLRDPNGKFTTFDVTGAGSGPYQGTGCYSDCPMGINDSGEITGSYQDSNSVQHGYLRTPGGSSVTIDPSGSVYTQPESINDSGVITGFYIDANNIFHGFLRQDHGN
jgi:hypothetical protein